MTQEDSGDNSREVSQEEIQSAPPPQAETTPEAAPAEAITPEVAVASEVAVTGPVLTDGQKVGLLEALLLASGDPLPIARVQEILGCSKAEVAQIAEALKESYAGEGRGLELVAVAQKLQLRTKAMYAEYVRQLIAVKPRKLSQAALETLAVIAYQQPVVKSEVDKIRGVDVAPTVKTLLERNLVKIIGYQASVGQPALYGTTEEFLSIFGLNSLSELPSLRDLKALAKEPGEASQDDAEEVKVEDAGDDEGEAHGEPTSDVELSSPVQ
jgi:segregation and condensation protein B